MAEYSRIAKGSFTAASGQTSAVIQLPFQPDFVEVWNLTNIGSAASAGNILRAYWDNNIPPFTPSGKSASQTMVEVYNATPAVIYDTIYTNGVTGGTTPRDGITTFSGGQLLQYGPSYGHNSVASADFSITKALPAVITTTTAHGLASGDVVIFEGLFETSTTGMPQLNGIPFTVTVTNSTTFSIPWDTSGSNYTIFNTATSTGNIGIFKKVLFPYLYFPGSTFISGITLGNTTTVTTTDAHNFRVGQEVAFRIPKQWGTVELNSLPNLQIPGSPMYGYVISVTDYHTVVVNINSSTYTPFVVNQTVASLTGLSYPQIVAVGDVNTGSMEISSGSVLYPPPVYEPIGTLQFGTINGPAIKGAFVNNTRMGFIIGNGTPQEQAGTGTIVTSGSEILWRAYLHDVAMP